MRLLKVRDDCYAPGVTIPYAILRKLEKGASKGEMLRKAGKRMIILFLLGAQSNHCGEWVLWIGVIIIEWILLYFLFKKKIFLKV